MQGWTWGVKTLSVWSLLTRTSGSSPPKAAYDVNLATVISEMVFRKGIEKKRKRRKKKRRRKSKRGRKRYVERIRIRWRQCSHRNPAPNLPNKKTDEARRGVSGLGDEG